MIGGPAGQQAEAALQNGRAVVFDRRLVGSKGNVTLALGSAQTPHATVPAIAVQSGLPIPWASVILPPAMAANLHLAARPAIIYIKHASSQPSSRLHAVDDALARLGIAGGIQIQRPYTNGIPPLLWAITAAVILLTTAATVAAVALLGADSLDDLATLLAVGADPRGRRRLARSRAAAIAVVGVTFGAAAGILPGAALVWRLRQHNLLLTQGNANPIDSFAYPLSIPWLHLAALIIATPILAAAAAALLTRTKPPRHPLFGPPTPNRPSQPQPLPAGAQP